MFPSFVWLYVFISVNEVGQPPFLVLREWPLIRTHLRLHVPGSCGRPSGARAGTVRVLGCTLLGPSWWVEWSWCGWISGLLCGAILVRPIAGVGMGRGWGPRAHCTMASLVQWVGCGPGGFRGLLCQGHFVRMAGAGVGVGQGCPVSLYLTVSITNEYTFLKLANI